MSPIVAGACEPSAPPENTHRSKSLSSLRGYRRSVPAGRLSALSDKGTLKMPGMRALMGFTLASLLASPSAQADPAIAPAPPCAAASGLNSAATDPASAPADWTQAQVNAIPGGDEIRDRDAYREQVTAFYQQHLTAYNAQMQRYSRDTALLAQFRLNSESAKTAIVRGGGSVIDPNPPSWPATPVEVGTRDLTLLANNVAVARAALAQSCDALEQDRLILDRLRSNR